MIFAALSAGALLLAGCTKTEVTEMPDGRAIIFSNFVTNAVKAPVDASEDLSAFYVYGNYAAENVFINQLVNVSWDGGTSTCTYTPSKFWVDNQPYYFAAYSDGNAKLDNGAVTYSQHHLEIDYTVGTEADFEGDLLYAYADGNGAGYTYNGTTAMQPVPFIFKHILSKITFSFTKAADLNGVDLTVTDLKVTANPSGTFTGTDLGGAAQYPLSAWGTTGTPEEVSFDCASLVLDDANNVTAGRATVADETSHVFIPQSVTGYTVKFTVTYDDPTIEGVDSKSLSFDVSIAGTKDNNWKPGYHYTYTAQIKASNLDLEPIVFTVTEVSGWTPEPVDDIVGEDVGVTIP